MLKKRTFISSLSLFLVLFFAYAEKAISYHLSKDKMVVLKDLLMGVEVSLKEKALTKGLKKGDIFAARLLPLDKGHAMSGSVYPFRAEDKKAVLEYVNRMFRRYTKNENPKGTMEDFIRDYGDVFNMAWIKIITG